jgi:hypothetical protein
MEKYGGLLSKPDAIKFWVDFAEHVIKKETPPFAAPNDPDGISQLEKLIDFMKCNRKPTSDSVPFFDLPDVLPTRDDQIYVEPYSGSYIAPSKRNGQYYPVVGQKVLINVESNSESHGDYNPLLIPEPGEVMKIDSKNKMIEVG